MTLGPEICHLASGPTTAESVSSAVLALTQAQGEPTYASVRL
jgi:hypothetical protein